MDPDDNIQTFSICSFIDNCSQFLNTIRLDRRYKIERNGAEFLAIVPIKDLQKLLEIEAEEES